MKDISAFDVTKFMDDQRLSRVHWTVLIVSALLMLIDGYDIVCVAYVAPLLRTEWSFAPASLGLLFGAAPLGAALGPILIGRAGDKFGRKPAMLGGAIWFGIFTLGSVWSTNLYEMVVLRLLAGFGIGIVVSVVIAYLSEFAPKRIRATMIVVGVVGVALGGGLAGLIAAQLLSLYTWRSVFWVGGCIPVVLGVIGFWVVPESPKFLALKPSRSRELVVMLKRLGAPAGISTTTRFGLAESVSAPEAPLGEVFKGRLAIIVPLLICTTFLAQFALFFVNQWTTILMTSSGIPVQRAAYATAAFQIVGFLGALAVMRPVDWFGFLPVPILFACAAGVITMMGIPGQSEMALIALAGAAGFCVIGLQFGNISTTGQIFPTHIRSMGVGVCYGLGRLGSVVGPVIAGVLIGRGFTVTSLFYVTGCIMLLGIIAGGLLVPLYKRQLEEIKAASSQVAPTGIGSVAGPVSV